MALLLKILFISWIVILIQTADLLWLFGTLPLSVYITMLSAVVRLHSQTPVGPQLPLAAEPGGRLHQGQQQVARRGPIKGIWRDIFTAGCFRLSAKSSLRTVCRTSNSPSIC